MSVGPENVHKSTAKRVCFETAAALLEGSGIELDLGTVSLHVQEGGGRTTVVLLNHLESDASAVVEVGGPSTS